MLTHSLSLPPNKTGDLSEAKKYLHSARSDYTSYLAETMVHFKVHNTLLSIKSKELKMSGFDQSDQTDIYGSDLPDKNEIEKIKERIDKNRMNITSIKLSNNAKMEIDKSTVTILTTIEENEHLADSNQEINQIYRKKHSFALDYSTRSKSEANLINFNEIEFRTNLIGNSRTLIEINNNQLNYQSNPQMNKSKNKKINNDIQFKELVNELGSFKERLIAKQRKNSILKRVKSLSKINFTKNLQNEVLKDEIEFDLQKRTSKRKLFKRRISGIF